MPALPLPTLHQRLEGAQVLGDMRCVALERVVADTRLPNEREGEHGAVRGGPWRETQAGRLDEVPIPVAPLDVLAQQIVAETIDRDWDLDDLFDLVRRADPYRRLARRDFDRTLEYLSEGISRAGGRSDFC